MGRKSVSESQRWEIIGLSRDKSKTKVEISKLVGVSEKCVRSTLKRFAETNEVKDSPRSGRPKKLSQRDDHFIFRQAWKNPITSNRNLAAEFNAISSKHAVSAETVRKVLKGFGIGSYTAVRKPLLRP